MNINADYSKALEDARARQKAAAEARNAAQAIKDAAVLKETQAQSNAEKEALESQEANNNVTATNMRLTSAQMAYNNALAQLNRVSSGDDETAKANAQNAVNNAYTELLAAQKEVKAAQDKAKIEAEEAEKAAKAAEEAVKELEEAETALAVAEAEVLKADEELKIAEQEAIAAEEAAKAEESALVNEVKPLTEAEAVAQGYTVIKTAEDLAAIANNIAERADGTKYITGNFILMGDIDLAGVDWSPIGSNEIPFAGSLNGNGFKISNLTINADDGANTGDVGLFGVTENASFSNLVLEDVDINTPETYSKGSVGALIGHAKGSTNVDNVAVTGDITGFQKVGGLIGTLGTQDTYGAGFYNINEKSNITNVKVDVDVKADYYAGGIVGRIADNGWQEVFMNNCTAEGNINVGKKGAGGFIGEAGDTIVTINNSTSGVNLTAKDGASRVGGFIGNANGTKIAICNSDYKGQIDALGDFQGEYYGYYMDDAHVTIFELSAGMPVDDILMIDGVDALTPVYNEELGKHQYEVTVSTLNGMDKLVAMIEKNPDLAELVTFNIGFDFEAMDEEYTSSNYDQYGVVQHLYEETSTDGTTTIVNDVYIDNEIDTESTFHKNVVSCDADEPVEAFVCKYKRTMIEGLYKDDKGNYYVFTGKGEDGFTKTTLQFFCQNQRTNVQTRLDKDQVKYREQITAMVKYYQDEMIKSLLERFNYDASRDGSYIIDEPEYEYLLQRQQNGEALTDIENLKLAVYQLDYKIIDMVNDVTHNEGCAMGGDASFLEETTAIPLKDENGLTRYQTLGGLELREKLDEEGNPMFDEDGNPMYVDLDGEDYSGIADVYTMRGYPKTDEEGRFLFSDGEGATVYRTENEDGTFTYTTEDGSEYQGDTETLTQQLEEYSISNEYKALEQGIKELYSGIVVEGKDVQEVIKDDEEIIE